MADKTRWTKPLGRMTYGDSTVGRPRAGAQTRADKPSAEVADRSAIRKTLAVRNPNGPSPKPSCKTEKTAELATMAGLRSPPPHVGDGSSVAKAHPAITRVA